MPVKKKTARKTKKSTPPEEIVQFHVKRHHLNAVLGVLVGLLLGYLLWGYDRPPATAQASDLASQLANAERHEVLVTSDDPVLGPEDAPVTVIVFADFQCPYCAKYALETHPRLLAEYGEKVRFVFKDFPISSIHPDAFPAALAGQCALAQEAFWAYHDLLFSGRLPLGREAYVEYADELGLDVADFTACYDEQRFSDQVQADFNSASQLGIGSTPTFLINGIAVVGAQPFSVFAQIIDYELGGQQ
jgi:protein-disulfide isomerase